MEFKRIDEDTVCCIVTEDDMEMNGLELEDFLQNKEKIQNFLHKIVEQAEEEVGYEAKKGILSMQVAMLPEHSLAITFSEKENLGIKDMLEQMKKAVATIEDLGSDQNEDLFGQLEEQVNGLKKMLEENEEKSEDEELLSELEMSSEEEQAETSEVEGPGDVKEPVDSKTSEQKEKRIRVGIFEFTSLKHVMECCRALEFEQQGNSSLYKYEDTFYLTVDNRNMEDTDFLKMCGNAIEFGKFSSNDERRIANLSEHGTCLIAKEAVRILGEI